MSEKVSTFAKRLREGLSIKNISQTALSTLSGVSKSSISRYLKGDWEGKQDAVRETVMGLCAKYPLYE